MFSPWGIKSATAFQGGGNVGRLGMKAYVMTDFISFLVWETITSHFPALGDTTVKSVNTKLDLTLWTLVGVWGFLFCLKESYVQLKQPQSFYLCFQTWALWNPLAWTAAVCNALRDFLFSRAFCFLKCGRLQGLQPPKKCKGCQKLNCMGSVIFCLMLNCLYFPVSEYGCDSICFYTSSSVGGKELLV